MKKSHFFYFIALAGLFANAEAHYHHHTTYIVEPSPQVVVVERQAPVVMVEQQAPSVMFIEAESAPPADFEEDSGVSPGIGYVWLKGHWHWNGGWVRVPGHWGLRPSEGAVWAPGYWKEHHGRWRWYEGCWG